MIVVPTSRAEASRTLGYIPSAGGGSCHKRDTLALRPTKDSVRTWHLFAVTRSADFSFTSGGIVASQIDRVRWQEGLVRNRGTARTSVVATTRRAGANLRRVRRDTGKKAGLMETFTLSVRES